MCGRWLIGVLVRITAVNTKGVEGKYWGYSRFKIRFFRFIRFIWFFRVSVYCIVCSNCNDGFFVCIFSRVARIYCADRRSPSV